mgnify:CR=1 FL=1
MLPFESAPMSGVVTRQLEIVVLLLVGVEKSPVKPMIPAAEACTDLTTIVPLNQQSLIVRLPSSCAPTMPPNASDAYVGSLAGRVCIVSGDGGGRIASGNCAVSKCNTNKTTETLFHFGAACYRTRCPTICDFGTAHPIN